MKFHKYDPNCPHCIPALMNVETGEQMKPDHPVMKKIMEIWWKQPYEVREAFIEVTCNNDRSPHTIALAERFISAMNSMDEPPISSQEAKAIH